LVASSCVDPTDLTDVPDDAILRVQACAASIKTLSACTVLGSVSFETGDAAGRDWTVDLSSNGGSFSDSVVSRTMPLRTDANGEVSVTFHAPADTGTIVFVLSGGGRQTADTLRVEKPDSSATKAVGWK
jgi:hypothetical protein